VLYAGLERLRAKGAVVHGDRRKLQVVGGGGVPSDQGCCLRTAGNADAARTLFERVADFPGGS